MADNRDAYFFTGEGSGDERKMEAWCADCRNKLRPGQGWFWDGNKGYGPWDVKCHSCGNYIHRVVHDQDKRSEKKPRKSRKANPSPGVQVSRGEKATL